MSFLTLPKHDTETLQPQEFRQEVGNPLGASIGKFLRPQNLQTPPNPFQHAPYFESEGAGGGKTCIFYSP